MTSRLSNPHYSAFYAGDPAALEGPVAVVLGNCQAESLRLFLTGPDLATIRMPAAHELLPEDLPALGRWLARADVLVSQPIRDGYHGLPVGSTEIRNALRPDARVVLVPVMRFAGLYPAHAIVRSASDPSLVPPLVEYHDLGVLAEAAALRDGVRPPRLDITPDQVLRIADESLGQLRSREERNATVVLSDVFAEPDFRLMRTLNHPANPVFRTAAVRVRERLGIDPTPDDPGRPVLDGVHAPRLPVVAAAFGLDEPEGPLEWIVDGRPVSLDEVRDEHLRWYAEHPAVVDAGVARHSVALRTLGLLA